MNKKPNIKAPTDEDLDYYLNVVWSNEDYVELLKKLCSAENMTPEEFKKQYLSDWEIKE